LFRHPLNLKVTSSAEEQEDTSLPDQATSRGIIHDIQSQHVFHLIIERKLLPPDLFSFRSDNTRSSFLN
jgi:hypothetical protein